MAMTRVPGAAPRRHASDVNPDNATNNTNTIRIVIRITEPKTSRGRPLAAAPRKVSNSVDELDTL